LELSVDAAEEARLEQVYSRGLGPWFLTGTNHQAVVKGRSPRHRGVRMGRVVRATHEGVVIEPMKTVALKPGDGVVFDAADWRSPQEAEEGGRVYQVEARAGKVELRFGNGAVDASRIRAGDLVWRTHDPALDKAVGGLPARKQAVHVKARARVGEPLGLEWRVGNLSVAVASDEPLGEAQNRALDQVFLREQLGRLGNTPYQLAGVELDVEGSPFASASLLNALRRRAVELLEARQGAPAKIAAADPIAAVAHLMPPSAVCGVGLPQLHLLVRTPEQLEAALEVRPASITLDYLDLYGLRPSLERIKAAGIAARVASPRVLKPGEERIAEFLRRCDCEILVRSAGLLEILSKQDPPQLSGDFSLNAANAITAHELFRRGVARLTPTHDLNAAQIAELARQAGADRIEAVVYQHLAVFHTEHCVFCRFLSTGTSYKDCGRPCEKHRVELRDESGRPHPVMADVGCRNTVFGAEAQEASAHLELWQGAGIRHFRAEFVHESREEVVQAARVLTEALSGACTSAELRRRLRKLAPQGTTEGSLFVPGAAFQLPVLQ
jgi:putative protease